MSTIAARLCLVLLVICLGFATGCGGGSNSNPPPPPPPANPNAQLNGQYTYQLTGLDLLNNPILKYFQRGAFTADGNGHLSAGMDDLSLQVGGSSSNAFTGTYNLTTDGTGTLTFNFGSGTLSFKAVIIDSATLYLSESDGRNESAGIAKKQDTTAFATPSGTFVFQSHILTTGFNTSSLSTSSVGVLNISGGLVTGQEDLNDNGTAGALTLTGSFAAPDANGRGTASLTDSASNTTNFIYCIQDANHFSLVPVSAAGTFYGIGQAEKQSAGPFTTASLSGGYAFGSDGEAALSDIRVRTAGRFTSAGDGTINAGVYDSITGDFVATPFSNIPFTGSYTVAANGRTDVTLTPSGSPIHEVLWLISPSRSYSLITDTTSVEIGTLDLQSGSFSNATLNGDFGFLASSRASDRAGILTGNGGGGANLTIFANPGTDPSMTATYSVSSNGRATASVTDYTAQGLFYFVSPNQAYFITTDPNSGSLNGSISKIQ